MTTQPPLNLLLVDDDHNDLALFALAVDEADLNVWVQSLRNGQEAVDYLEGRGAYAERSLHPLPQLIVLDLQMPIMDGFEFLNWRQQASVASSIPVVVFSGFAYQDELERTLSLGALRHFAKPVFFGEWKAVVREIAAFGREVQDMAQAPPARQ